MPIHRCQNCSSRLSKVQEIRERTIEDIPKTVVTKYRTGRRYCKSCKIMAGSPVDDALPNARLSIRTMLVVAYLKIGMGMSEENVSDAMRVMFGIAISEGKVDNILKLLAEASGDKYADLLQAIRDATYRHMDSTVMMFPLRCRVNTGGRIYMTGTAHLRPWRARQATISSTAGPTS